MKKILLSALLLSFCISNVSCAASFDCAKASNATEKLICNNESLSQLDEQLAGSYKQELEKTTDKDALKKTQVEWLKQQRACKDVDCLTQSYQARNAELNNITSAASQSVISSSGTASSTQNTPIDNSKKPLTFKLVFGDSYPICQPYVDMLNKTKYTEYPACERKILPEFSQFKAVQWTEITDKNEILKILKERVEIQDEMNKKISKYQSFAWNNAQKEVEEGHSKLYCTIFDFDNDGEEETIYKRTWLYLDAKKWNQCEIQNTYYVKDKKITLENAKSLWPGNYFHFNTDGHNDLFFIKNNVFVSNWTTKKLGNYDLNIYDRDTFGTTICGINIQ